MKTERLVRIQGLLLLCLMASITWGQPQFTKVKSSPVVEQASDSRSVNFVDVNNDGWEDLFISNGPSSGQNNFLYINQGDGTFTSLTNDPIVQDGAKSDGATFADIDNDGDIDAYVVTWYGQQNFLYRNQGNGSFLLDKDPTLTTQGTYSETASWGDVNQDGWLDLFLTNSEGKSKQNQLFISEAGKRFEILSTPATQTNTLSRSVSWADVNIDGKIDLLITNEGKSPNELYLNSGKAPFFHRQQNPIWEGLARGTMSASWGDVDNDGDLDVFLANAGYYKQVSNQLLLNDGQGNFTLHTESGLSEDGGCSYGSAFADYDNDGDLDLIVANGFCKENLENWLYENDGAGNFTRATEVLPEMASYCSFGVAWGDINNDGFLDLAIANCQNGKNQAQPANDLYLNKGNKNHWLNVKLKGTTSNSTAVGAIIRVHTKRGWQMRQITAQSGYCGQNSLIAHFGLGSARKVKQLEVWWPNGKKTQLGRQRVDQTLVLTED